MKFKVDSDNFKPIVEYLNNLFHEVKFEFNATDGIEIKQMDKSCVAGVLLKIRPDFFEGISGEGSFVVNSSDLKKATKEKGLLEIEVGSGKLQIKGKKKTINLPLIMEEPNKLPPTEKMDEWKEAEVEYKLEDLQKDISPSVLSSESGTLFKAAAGKFSMTHYGFDYIKTENVESELIPWIKDKDVESKYANEMLQKIISFKGETCKIRFGKNLPFVIVIEGEGFDLKAFLAPRVEQD